MPATRLAIGRRIAPPRFVLFGAVALAAVPAGVAAHGWREGVMLGFDASAIAFLLACLPLLRGSSPARMRAAARDNDANRAALLVVTALTVLAVLAAVAAELTGEGERSAGSVALVVATLVLGWTFANGVFALHYAHLFYTADTGGGDGGGLNFPGTDEPDYRDFAYFAFTLGMTFQTSDVAITRRSVRGIATGHSLLAFVFNLGVVAFTVNVLGGG